MKEHTQLHRQAHIHSLIWDHILVFASQASTSHPTPLHTITYQLKNGTTFVHDNVNNRISKNLTQLFFLSCAPLSAVSCFSEISTSLRSPSPPVLRNSIDKLVPLCVIAMCMHSVYSVNFAFIYEKNALLPEMKIISFEMYVYERAQSSSSFPRPLHHTKSTKIRVKRKQKKKKILFQDVSTT